MAGSAAADSVVAVTAMVKIQYRQYTASCCGRWRAPTAASELARCGIFPVTGFFDHEQSMNQGKWRTRRRLLRLRKRRSINFERYNPQLSLPFPTSLHAEPDQVFRSRRGR
ncbi:MAG TPA: hypothetical protein DG414_09730 [Gammaproteobacteria bacterium]|nr:hypothetical protein [Gammaproteobacteria bacterium]|tara:strand:- start:379 stop:711 length:333 start_codon:yes stop_codon:yes gene_type:complete